MTLINAPGLPDFRVYFADIYAFRFLLMVRCDLLEYFLLCKPINLTRSSCFIVIYNLLYRQYSLIVIVIMIIIIIIFIFIIIIFIVIIITLSLLIVHRSHFLLYLDCINEITCAYIRSVIRNFGTHFV